MRSFTTIVALEIPEKVTLVSPINNVYQHPYSNVFVWNIAARAESYIFKYGINPNPLFFNEYALDNPSATFQAIPLFFGLHYHWRVKAVNSTGEGEWSDIGVLNTIVLPPVLTFPENNGRAETTPDMSWEAVSGAASYTLQVGTDSLFNNSFTWDNIIETNKTIKLIMGQKYFWRVKTNNSNYSPVQFFFTGGVQAFIAGPARRPKKPEVQLTLSQVWDNIAKSNRRA
ncbi:MAG: hypothetical protein WC616_01390 [Candidatus Omnitrophota bacterium]